MSVWRDMARDAGMTPIDEAAAYIEETERRKDEERQNELMQVEAEFICENEGHEWAPAGGGLEICVRCQAEQWGDDAEAPF